MYILAGEKTLTITNYGTQRNKITGQLILTLKTAKENATAAELEALTDYIAENAPVIEVYDDNDVKEASLAGFKLYPTFALTKVGTWEIVVENESENTFQIERANEKIATLEQTAAAQEQTIQEQAVTILNQWQAIIDQNLLITGQAETIKAQGAAITSQGETIAAQNEVIAGQKETINQQAEELVLLNDTLLEILMG